MSEKSNTSKDTATLIEQYKLYVEMTDKVSERRIDATKLHISLLTALLAAVSLALGQNLSTKNQNFILVMTGIMGVALCFVWFFNINTYRQLNSLKFKVIHEMEKELPFACYSREWEILDKNPKEYKYRRLWKIEQLVPLLLLIIYLVLLIYSLLNCFDRIDQPGWIF